MAARPGRSAPPRPALVRPPALGLLDRLDLQPHLNAFTRLETEVDYFERARAARLRLVHFRVVIITDLERSEIRAVAHRELHAVELTVVDRAGRGFHTLLGADLVPGPVRRRYALARHRPHIITGHVFSLKLAGL